MNDHPPPPPARKDDRIGPSSAYLATVTILFVLIGLPPGLCSLYFTPPAIWLLLAGGAESRDYAMLFAVPCLLGLIIFGVLLWWLIRTWGRVAP